MAEECKICIKEETIKRIQDDIVDTKRDVKEITTIVSNMKDNYMDTKYSLRDIKSNQDAMVIADKENKATMKAGFDTIENKRLADELKIAKEKEDAKKAQDIKDADSVKEKKATRQALYVAIAILAINTAVGLAVKFVLK